MLSTRLGDQSQIAEEFAPAAWKMSWTCRQAAM